MLKYTKINSTKWIAEKVWPDGSVSRAATAEWDGSRWVASKDANLDGQRHLAPYPHLALRRAVGITPPPMPSIHWGSAGTTNSQDNGLTPGVDY